MSASASDARSEGVVRVAIKAGEVDSLDPALSYAVALALLVDTTCASLIRHNGGHGGSSLQPEVAAGCLIEQSEPVTIEYVRPADRFDFVDAGSAEQPSSPRCAWLRPPSGS